jgi:hypothetical protein
MIWFQLAAFVPLAILGWVVGRWAASRAFAVLVGGCFAALLLVIVGHRVPRAAFVAPVSWAVHPEVFPLLMTALVSALFSTLLVKLPKPRRAAVVVVMVVMLVNYGLLPAAMPLWARSALASTRTLLDRQGVCRQTHGYTCGPASAVTCLGRLGIRAEEGDLAIAARCGPVVGTHGVVLAAALEERFPKVTARHRFVESPEALRLPAAVEIVMPLIGGHFVAVLAVGEEYVEVGDPLNGASRMPRQEFEKWWTGAAVEIGLMAHPN